MNKITKIINNRPVAIMAHGSSIYQLEDYITELKDYDICWTSLGLFPPMQDFILDKIDKYLEIVFHTASVPDSLAEHYEDKIRLPRIHRFLINPRNLWITSYGIIRDSVRKYRPGWIAKDWKNEGRSEDRGRYSDQIQIVDYLVNDSEIPNLMNVPNSITLFIGSLLAGGASKIILFGVDGYKGEGPCPSEACYKPELIEKERLLAIGQSNDFGINRDTDNFEQRFPEILGWYRKRFQNNAPIYNCSPGTNFTVIPEIKYGDLHNLLK